MINHNVLQAFDNATHIFSYQNSKANPSAPTKNVLDTIKVKWHSYFNEFPHIYGIVVILDPGVKINERLCELYGAVIQPEPVGSSSRCKSRFGFLGPFPVLPRIAKDILGIPASTIAFKSAFSASRRVLDEK
ncbi:putative AC transposase [Bienertia sinuspersici]